MSPAAQHLWQKLLKHRRWVAFGGLAVAAVGVAWLGVSTRSAAAGGGQRATDNEEPVSVRVETASVEETPLLYEATGTVRSELESELAARVMGRVARMDVREGDMVQAGQPLIWLDARDLGAAVAQAGAGERAARVGAETAVVAARMERSSSTARIEAARALVRQSEAAVAAAKARLDMVKTGPRKQERAQAALAVAQAKAALDLAEADLQRMSALYADGAVSRQQLDAAQTQRDVARARHDAAVEAYSMAEEGSRAEDVRSAEEGLRQAEAALDAARQGLRQAEAAALMADVRDQEIRGARAQVKQAEAALMLARTTQGFTVIRAPYAGVVTRRLADPGDMASPGVPLLAVQGGSLRMEASVPESVLRSVRRGDRVSVSLDALPGRELSGLVVEITPHGDPTSHTFVVRIELPRHSGALSGMFGRAFIPTGTQRRLAVPADAVVTREGLTYVFVIGDTAEARMRLVTVGKRYGGRVPILSGLAAGERVVVSSAELLRDGRKVRF